MKSLRIAFLILAAGALASGTVYAFHDGGVATCTRCHSMHSSPAGDNLLVATDAGSTCLSCHERAGDTAPNSYHISTAAADLTLDTDVVVQRTPGGDFGWLRQDLSATASYGRPLTNYGYTRGHNIIAADNGYTFVDGTAAPGGTMPSNQLSCVSCHDPHGQARRDNTNTIIYPAIGTTFPPTFGSGSYGGVPPVNEAYGVYRLLGGSGYTAWDAVNFPGAPAAVVNSTYNREETDAFTRTAYGYGTTGGYATWSKWCATCHPGMHNETSSNLVHVVDLQLNGGSLATADVYNAYVKTGDLTGDGTAAFTSLVPFASNTNDILTLEALALIDDTNLNGPAGTDRILCLSCHRAHASGWRWALRWNQGAEFLTLGDFGSPVYPGTDAGLGNQGQFNQGYTTAQMQAAYNGRPATDFAAHQRSLCNKCHMKD